MIPQDPFDFYHSLPIVEQYYGQEPLDSQTLIAFTRLHGNEDKYTGNVYDLLDDKAYYCLSTFAKRLVLNQHSLRFLPAKPVTLLSSIPRTDNFGQQYKKVKSHLKHEIHRGKYFTDWTSASFEKLRVENRDKSPHEILEILIDKMQLYQRALGPRYIGDEPNNTGHFV